MPLIIVYDIKEIYYGQTKQSQIYYLFYINYNTYYMENIVYLKLMYMVLGNNNNLYNMVLLLDNNISFRVQIHYLGGSTTIVVSYVICIIDDWQTCFINKFRKHVGLIKEIIFEYKFYCINVFIGNDIIGLKLGNSSHLYTFQQSSVEQCTIRCDSFVN